MAISLLSRTGEAGGEGGEPRGGSRLWHQAPGPRRPRPARGQRRWSLSGAEHLAELTQVSHGAQGARSPPAEQRGRSSLELHFQHACRPPKRGLTVLPAFGVLSRRCQKSHHRDDWRVAAKRSQPRRFSILQCRLCLSS